MLIDTHCHLDAAEFDADRAGVASRAAAAGVSLIVVPAVDAGNFGTVRELATTNPALRYALGIHPLFVRRAADADLQALRQALAQAIDDPRLVAVGEIGLDFFEPDHDRQRQEDFFCEQLRIARDFELPVLMHVRRSQDIILKHLRRIRPGSGIAHAFNGSRQQAEQFLELGMALGFGGAMTFDRARQIRRLVAELPPEAHVLETDAPDIAPEWINRQRNEPGELPRIAQVFAQLRGIDAAAAIAQTGRNALRVLPRLSQA
ncbi:MAG: TatD family hydrolase [Burkholderiales bacterium]|mgnify:CR=1 FL=1|nr:TatD family hydrolase [Burkholderiales bacterium]